MKKVVVLGGGTGMSTLLRGLKQFPLEISAIVSVSDDGRSTGRLRKEFKTPAVGDIRQVIVALSETEPLVKELLNYRFKTTSDLNGHTVGNLLLTAMSNITGNLSNGIESLSKVFSLKGKVIPLTEDNITLMAKMTDGTLAEGEHDITGSNKTIEKIYYKEKPVVTPEAIHAIKQADLIILSMGSLYTSIIPNLLCPELVETFSATNSKILYICNMMTQPGETDNFSVSDHIKVLNRYLGKRKIDVVIANNGEIREDLINKYSVMEQKSPVLIDENNIKDIELIKDNFVIIEEEMIRHDNIKLAFHIFSYLLKR
jgi:uncharacterized cofD-like protein